MLWRMSKEGPLSRYLDYHIFLELIGLPTLAYRRVRDMIKMYKILCKKYGQDVTDFIELTSDTTRRGHSVKVYIRYALD